MFKGIYILLISILCLYSNANALEWKSLHEEADEKNLKDALASLNRNPESLADLYILGLVYLNLHKNKNADKVFGKMFALDPESVEAKWGLAEVLRRRKDIEKSQELLNNIIDSNPDFSPAYISLAYLKYTQTEFKQAIRLALRVQKQGKDNVDLSNYTRSYLIFSGAKGMIASSALR